MNNKVQLLSLSIENINNIFDLKISDLREIIDVNNLTKISMKYGIVYNYDSVDFGKIDEVKLDIENIMEARFFNDNSEIVFRIEEDSISGNIIKDNDIPSEQYCEEKFLIYENVNKNNKKGYNRLKVKKYIDYDEDGQAYFYYTKPCKLERRIS